jgi:hypothetical protein
MEPLFKRVLSQEGEMGEQRAPIRPRPRSGEEEEEEEEEEA